MYNRNSQSLGGIYHEIVYSTSGFDILDSLAFGSGSNISKHLSLIDFFMFYYRSNQSLGGIYHEIVYETEVF